MKTLQLIVLFVLFSKNCYAYLDLNLGSMILQGFLGGIAATVTTISIYWSKFKILIIKLKKKYFHKKNDTNI